MIKNSDFEVEPMVASEIPFIVNYWASRSDDQLLAMGADPSKMPSSTQFSEMLHRQLETHVTQAKGFVLIWKYKSSPIGHNNVNELVYGESGLMHLHIWSSDFRQRGFGEILLKKAIPLFFNILDLKYLRCTPFAENPAPNKLLTRIGFKYLSTYETTPGPINLKQKVNEYRFDKTQLGFI